MVDLDYRPLMSGLHAAEKGSYFDQALRLIRSSSLEHPQPALLECFVNSASDIEVASKYFIDRCCPKDSSDSSPAAQRLGDFLTDWTALVGLVSRQGPQCRLDNASRQGISRRDGDSCSITGAASSFWDPLVVMPLLRVGELYRHETLLEMATMFLGSHHRDWLIEYSKRAPEGDSPYQTHWLVRKSAGIAYLDGHVYTTKRNSTTYAIQNSLIGFSPPILRDLNQQHWYRAINRSTSQYELVDPTLLSIQSKFAQPMRWVQVARDIAARQKIPARQSTARLSPIQSIVKWAMGGVLAVWLKFPSALRIRAYSHLETLGRYWYGATSVRTQKLPCGMYLKWGTSFETPHLRGEHAALQLVRRYTSIPVPEPLDLVVDEKGPYLLMSAVPGEPAAVLCDLLSDDEAAVFAQDLRRCVDELRTIPKQVNPGHAITNAAGEACVDYRVDLEPVGPFVDEAAFFDRLRVGARPDAIHRPGYRIVFTHGDINLRNILIDPVTHRLSGIVDWECAGWYPEFWEYTKTHSSIRRHHRWLEIMDRSLGGAYQKELEVERIMQQYFSPF